MQGLPAKAAPSPVAQQEIQHLFAFIEQSPCEFSRNGSWYTTKDAVKHIRRKYQYLLDRDLTDTAELFIERAASESSFSGKAYQVRCSGQGVVRSGDWLRAELARYRAKPGGN
nr:DUF5329 domain-containing protein [Limnobacter humi]